MERLSGEAIIINGIEKSIGSSLCEVSAGIAFYSKQETSSAVLDAKQLGEDKQAQDSIIPYGTPTDESSGAGAGVRGTLPHHSVLLQFTANPSSNLQVEIMQLAAGMLSNPNITVGDSSPLCNPNINEGSPPSCFPNPNLNDSSPSSYPNPNRSESSLFCNPPIPNTNINEISPASRLALAEEEGAQQRLVSSHACKYCSKTFPSGRALGGHMRAHGSFSVHWEGVGTVDIMANDQQHINRKIITVHHQLTSPSMFDTQLNDEQMQQERVNLGTNCRLEIDYQSVEDGQAGEEEDDEELGHNQQLIYALRRNPKRNRRFSDQEFSSEEETMVINNANDNIDLSPPNSAVSLMPISCSKKPMFSNLQERAVPAVCTECGKEFNSWKALFGHMRCHPEREWRGIQPPAEYCMRGNRDAIASTTMQLNSYHGKPVQPSNYALMRRKKMIHHFKSGQISHAHDDNHVVNQTKEGGLAASTATDCIKGELQWSAKEVMLEDEEESEAESIEAAYISNRDNEEVPNSSFLQRGKRSRRSHFTVKSLRAVELAEFAPAKLAGSHPSPQIMKQEEIEMANCLVMLALAGSVSEQQEGETTDDDELGLDWSDKLAEAEEHYFGGAATSAGGDASISGSSTKFECATCKRSFKTHQALGGHRASHKKVKGCFAKTTIDFDTCTTAIGADTPNHHHHQQLLQLEESDAASSKLRSQPQNSKCHQCSICLRVFSSGQALGGHKRCHWAADKVVALSETHTTISTLACVAAAPPLTKATFFTRPPEDRVQLLLDLNLPAPLDEDERKHHASNAEATFTTALRSKGDVQELDARAAIGSFLSLGHAEAPTNVAQRSRSEAAVAPSHAHASPPAPSNAHSSSLAPPISIHEIVPV